MLNWNKYSVFKLPNKHKRFEYIPRYYDPRKEELEKKIRAAEKEANPDKKFEDYSREISFRQKTSDKWGNTDFKSKMMRANARLIVIFVVCLIGFYYLYTYLSDVALFLDDQTGK